MATVRTFLLEHGLIQAHDVPSASSQFRIQCPKCHNDDCKAYVDATGKGWICFQCSARGSYRSFQRLFEPPTPEEIEMERFVTVCEESLELSKYYKYFEDRGFTSQTIRELRFGICIPENLGEPGEVAHKLGLAVDGKWYFANRLIIPYIIDGIPVTVRGRVNPDDDDDRKYLGIKGSKAMPYIPQAIDPSQPVIVCEGELDAAMLRQHGYQAIGSPGANSFNKDWVKDYATVYIAFDADKTGRENAEKIVRSLEEVRKIELPERFDCSEYIETFGKDSFAYLVDRATLYVFGNAQKDDRLKYTVEEWSDWAFSNEQLLGPSIRWAPRLEKAISGWSKGVFLLGAVPNSGKSCLLVQSAYRCAIDNPKTSVAVYLSLDDDIEDAVTRLISHEMQLDFEVCRSPRYYLDNPHDPSKRDAKLLNEWFQTVDKIKSIDNLIFRDAKFGRSIDYLRNYFRSLRTRFPERDIVIFLDSLAKITPSESDSIDTSNKSAWKAFLAQELKYLSTVYELCIVTPTDLRKLNEGRRPVQDDLKDSAELAYEANCVILGFNEVNMGVLPDDSVLTWEFNGERYPLFELNFSKNKKTKFKGVIRFKFFPDTCTMAELTAEEDSEIDYLIRQKQEQAKEKRIRAVG